MDLGTSTSTNASLKKLQEDGALPGHGVMEREVGGTEPQPVLGHMVAIKDYILCGFLPPPSEFLLLVLNFYGLSLLHLNPNSIAFLSIFPHLCEAYIGVEPFLDLFRFYYELRWMESNRIKNSDPVFVVPEEQQDKISSWTAKPVLAPSLQCFIDAIDDLRVRGLSGYEVATDFVGRRIQPLQARAHPAFDYSGPEDATRVSPRGLSSATVECRVGQLMISGPTTASDIPVPLCEKEATEREAAINALPLTDVIGPLADHQAAASLKESVAREMSDVAAAAATSGSRVPKMRRTFTSVLGSRRKASSPPAVDASPPPPRQRKLVTLGEKSAQARAAQDRSGGASRASPAAASTDVVVVSKSREAMPSGPSSGLGPTRGPPADVLTWEELQAEMKRILEAGTRGISCEIKRRRQWQRHRRTSVPTSCNTTWRRLARTSRK
uniref:Transposase (putative) gypsy type domain-containing protein n=1 Tax=Oryza sativa subsp. japonica TaxID=39947 RepID=Q8LMD1_ORYSJ|nr:Hypothetical protein similar to putative transposable elements [Oryza sativa Japonica Group]